MSVEPSVATSEVWTRWQGHVINGTFPLGRYLGCSDHSGVFLTRAAVFGPSELAIKLVPTNRSMAEVLLPRWKRAGGLVHPGLLTLWQWGGCQLEGLPYLYVVMEYADQTLAQLLRQRAMTDEEAREMLPPILDALDFLHRQDLVQGQLKPANILVVGEQLKLASDTVRRVGEGTISSHAATAYDPPEGRQGSTSAASDVWALGVTLFEALTRRLPPASSEPGQAIALPADFSPAFRDVVSRCLSADPHARPEVSQLAGAGRASPPEPVAAAVEPAAAAPSVPAEPATGEPGAAGPVVAEAVAPEPGAPEATGEYVFAAPDAARPAPAVDESATRRPPGLGLIIGVLVLAAVAWAGIRLLAGHRAPGSSPPAREAPAAPAPAPAGGPTLSAAKPARAEPPPSSGALHEVIPEVPWSARRTIRGHIKVWVRIIVNPDGSVFAAVPDRTGPSRYFQRLALDAAKKWTFPPADGASQRIMQLHFDFSRDGATARAVTVR